MYHSDIKMINFTDERLLFLSLGIRRYKKEDLWKHYVVLMGQIVTEPRS